jgi:microcystin-dependent protein
MSDPFIGEIRMFGGSFAPVNWAFCNGQLMAIDQNDALYALIGTTYGGDGVNTFGLPDLQGRIPLHQGSNGGNTAVIGQLAGVENVTLTTNQLPIHNHPVSAAAGANSASPANNLLASTATGSELYARAGSAGFNQAAPQEIPPSGGSNFPHDNMMPFLAVSFIICLFGIFPSRN